MKDYKFLNELTHATSSYWSKLFLLINNNSVSLKCIFQGFFANFFRFDKFIFYTVFYITVFRRQTWVTDPYIEYFYIMIVLL